jgi:mono/diheme cytochrome c family protein
MRPRRAVSALALVLLVACQGQRSDEPPIVPLRNMHEQPRYDPQERSDYFEDERTMRPPVAGTFAREMVVDPELASGLATGGGYLPTIPDAIVREASSMEALLTRGRERYGIYCTPCHGGLGDGQGLVPRVSQAAAFQPPTFHDDRIRSMPDGQLYATITNGVRVMPPYAAQTTVFDRWSIVAYVRALQMAQLDVPTEEAPR